jgi:hypothetical protein
MQETNGFLLPLINLWSMHFLKMKQYNYNYPQSTVHSPQAPTIHTTQMVWNPQQRSDTNASYCYNQRGLPGRTTPIHHGLTDCPRDRLWQMASMDHCHWHLIRTCHRPLYLFRYLRLQILILQRKYSFSNIFKYSTVIFERYFTQYNSLWQAQRNLTLDIQLLTVE